MDFGHMHLVHHEDWLGYGGILVVGFRLLLHSSSLVPLTCFPVSRTIDIILLFYFLWL
jgi:hypothetical protein